MSMLSTVTTKLSQFGNELSQMYQTGSQLIFLGVNHIATSTPVQKVGAITSPLFDGIKERASSWSQKKTFIIGNVTGISAFTLFRMWRVSVNNTVANHEARLEACLVRDGRITTNYHLNRAADIIAARPEFNQQKVDRIRAELE
ncbi:MAG: hypothetical protein KDK76_03610 [Chlamydiia bacterium]|nr:hypothetical protein [Chlamydiia bacterium]